MDTRIQNNASINRTGTKYNSVRSKNASFSDVAVSVAEKIGDIAYENKRRAARERANAPVIVKKHVKAKAFPISFVFYALITTIMLMFVVYSYSVVNEVSYDITSLEAQIANAKSENEILNLELDKRNDLKHIEEIATTKLGMVKSTDVVKHYVSISGGDKVVVSQKETAASQNLGVALDSLKETVGKIYN